MELGACIDALCHAAGSEWVEGYEEVVDGKCRYAVIRVSELAWGHALRHKELKPSNYGRDDDWDPVMKQRADE